MKSYQETTTISRQTYSAKELFIRTPSTLCDLYDALPAAIAVRPILLTEVMIVYPIYGIDLYIVKEKENDLTLIDTCFRSELPKLENYVRNAGYELKQIRRIILTHVHPDHIQATNEKGCR